MAAKLHVTYKKSSIGYSQRQKDTVKSLGLRRLGQTSVLPDNPAIRGMVLHVRHLVTVEERDEPESAAAGGTAEGATTVAPRRRTAARGKSSEES